MSQSSRDRPSAQPAAPGPRDVWRRPRRCLALRYSLFISAAAFFHSAWGPVVIIKHLLNDAKRFYLFLYFIYSHKPADSIE